MPEGNEVDVGIATQRSSGTWCPARSGRARLPSSFIGWFTTSEAAPIAATPVTAARRPAGPPNAASAAATRNHGLEWFAKCDSRLRGTSRTGVDSSATAT